MMGVFLDPVGLLAMWDVRDQWHESALAAFARLSEEGADVCTTTFVLAECGNAVSRTSARTDFITFGGALETDGCLVKPSDADWQEAWARYEAGFPGGPGLVDEISFVVTRRLGLKEAFTNDRHFTDAGFHALF